MTEKMLGENFDVSDDIERHDIDTAGNRSATISEQTINNQSLDSGRVDKLPVPAAGSNVPTVSTDSPAPLLERSQSELFRRHWTDVQTRFVDEPRVAVQQADTLVSDVIVEIKKVFTNEHTQLESQWKEGNDVSTEDLRHALQRYRSFFNRLVA